MGGLAPSRRSSWGDVLRAYPGYVRAGILGRAETARCTVRRASERTSQSHLNLDGPSKGVKQEHWPSSQATPVSSVRWGDRLP
jgi:hypothetical protein